MDEVEDLPQSAVQAHRAEVGVQAVAHGDRPQASAHPVGALEERHLAGVEFTGAFPVPGQSGGEETAADSGSDYRRVEWRNGR
ncbi:hypothetical protein GCM10010349_76670 [Streptomyces flavofungini]|nr:hypothetical protein GCM10010349_76670 [Streptomyces flavofungini]